MNYELEVLNVKMIKGLKRRMDEQSEKLEVFNELENIKMNQTDEDPSASGAHVLVEGRRDRAKCYYHQ